MRRRWVGRTVEASAADVWDLLVDVRRWPEWGPTVRSAVLDHRAITVELGSRGTVTTSLGLRLPFAVNRFEPGRAWSWKVAGVPATDHEVEPVTATSCHVRFGAPILEWPYLAVCAVALQRIARLATTPDRRAT